jgi:hypothetical protein
MQTVLLASLLGAAVAHDASMPINPALGVPGLCVAPASCPLQLSISVQIAISKSRKR